MDLILPLLLVGCSLVSADTSIVSWWGHRGAIIQDVVVLEGGTLTEGTWSNSKWNSPSTADVSYGLYKNLSLCNSIDISNQNTYSLLANPGPVPPSASSDWPVYSGGGMFYNNHQFYTYG